MNFSEKLIAKLKEVYKIHTDKNFYEKFQIPQSTFSSWKKRDAIDLRYLLETIPFSKFIEAYSKTLDEDTSVMFSKLRVAEEEVKYEQRSLLELQKQENAALKETVDILQSELLILQKEQNELLKELNQLLKTR